MVAIARRTYFLSWFWAGVVWLVIRLWWNVVHIAEQPIWLWPIAVVTVLLVVLVGFAHTFPMIVTRRTGTWSASIEPAAGTSRTPRAGERAGEGEACSGRRDSASHPEPHPSSPSHPRLP